jgi:hypothetical protein
MKNDKMAGECSTHGKMNNELKNFGRKRKEDHLIDLGADGRILLIFFYGILL